MSFEYTTRVGTYGHGKQENYFHVYDRHFTRYRNTMPVVLEIGVQDGNSIIMWQDFFGNDAIVCGIDLDPRSGEKCPKNPVFIGDQSDTAFLQKVLEITGPPDIVIDDGSHFYKDQVASFEFLYPRMRPNGVYLVEDLHADYVNGGDENGEPHKPYFKGYIMGLADQLEMPYANRPVTVFSRSTRSIHFYESVIVIEKGSTRINRFFQDQYLSFNEDFTNTTGHDRPKAK